VQAGIRKAQSIVSHAIRDQSLCGPHPCRSLLVIALNSEVEYVVPVTAVSKEADEKKRELLDLRVIKNL
jgi:hypothetical protein